MAATKSRLTLARAAIRPAMHGKIMVSGPAGAGKTYSSLVIAETLCPPDGRILHVDTEKESALTYADEFKFEHLRWAPPFDPRELQDTLMDAGGKFDVVIVDSFSHFWNGSGGILDIANGRFTGWKDARPAHVDVVEAVLAADCHVIICTRSKMAYAQQTAANGKQEVIKLGMAAIQDDNLEYEVNVAIEMDMQHVLNIGKSRTNAIPVGRTFPAGHAHEFAALYRDWLQAGEPVAERGDVAGLVETLNTIRIEAERVKAKQMFLEFFGRPEFILVSRYPEAQAWVADHVAAVNDGVVAGAATAGPDEMPDGLVVAGGSTPEPAAAPRGSQEPSNGNGGPTLPLGDAKAPADSRR